jgi:SAM-dependent methyltransferase
MMGEIQISSLLLEKLLEPERTFNELNESLSVAKGKVLDYGAGIGELSLFLAQNDIDVTYFEVNNECESFANYLFDKYDVSSKIQHEINQNYDTIFALNVIDHLDEPIDTLSYFYELLNKKGRLIISLSYDTEVNPVHISDENKINEIEKFLLCYFREVVVSGQNDHHRVLEKREKAINNPKNIDGFYLYPPLQKFQLYQLEVVIAPDVEIIQTKTQIYIGFKQVYRSRMIIENNLKELLLQLFNETNCEALYEWAELNFRVHNFKDSFLKIINHLWENQVIIGKVLKGGETND